MTPAPGIISKSRGGATLTDPRPTSESASTARKGEAAAAAAGQRARESGQMWRDLGRHMLWGPGCKEEWGGKGSVKGVTGEGLAKTTTETIIMAALSHSRPCLLAHGCCFTRSCRCHVPRPLLIPLLIKHCLGAVASGRKKAERARREGGTGTGAGAEENDTENERERAQWVCGSGPPAPAHRCKRVESTGIEPCC